VYDAAVMQIISLFEHLTRAHVKDCMNGNPVIFVVHEGEMAKAIGKGGANVRNLERKLKKRVKVVEFKPGVLEFVKNLVAPLRLQHAELVDSKLVLTAKDLRTRGLLIGRNASNLRGYEAIIQRYFPIEELRVK